MVIYTFYIFKLLAYLIRFFPQCFAKLSDYRTDGLSSHRTIDTYPVEVY